MTRESTDLTRRRLLGLGLATGAGAALGSLGSPVAARAAAGSGPVSMAMHIHASFSEGQASMEAQLAQAAEHGVDVLWWTEHDFRLRATGYRQAVRFEGMSEPEGDAAWHWTADRSGPAVEADGAFVTDEHSPREEGSALRLRVRGPGQPWGALTYTGSSWNHTYTTSLAATVLELDVLGEQLGRDAELVVRLELSYHPARGGRPAGRYCLEYRVGEPGPRTTEDDGLTGVVPLASTGTWQTLVLDPTDDISALWPDTVAADNALLQLSVGVRARGGATAQAVVDRLRFQRARRSTAAAALALQAGLIARYADRFPGVRQYQATELSLVRHLNLFGDLDDLPDYLQEGAHKDDSLEAALRVVEWARRQGGLLSYNHPLDGPVDGPADLARVLVTTRNLGADALEVGSPQDVEQAAWAYDVAARNAVFATATGVSDDHTGRPWDTRRARWITSAWSPTASVGDLTAAVAAGRAYFWDLAGWSGALDLQLAGAPAMGGVHLTGDPTTVVEVLASDLPRGGSLELVVGRVDLAGTADLTPAVEVTRLPASQVRGPVPVTVAPGSYVRAAVRAPGGSLVGFSNPVWVLGQAPAGGVPAARRL